MDKVGHTADILTDTGQSFHRHFAHINLGDIVCIFQCIGKAYIRIYIFIHHLDIVPKVFHNAFRTQHLCCQRL